MAAPLISLATGIAMPLRVDAPTKLAARLMHCIRGCNNMAVAAVDVVVDYIDDEVVDVAADAGRFGTWRGTAIHISSLLLLFHFPMRHRTCNLQVATCRFRGAWIKHSSRELASYIP